MYAFPPAALPTTLVRKIVALGVRVALIVPVWQQAEWWPFVCTLATVRNEKAKHCMIAGEVNSGHPFCPSCKLDQALYAELQAEAFNP
jgi:hypothetical protein